MSISTLRETAQIAVDTFHTFDENPPELIPTGIGVIDRATGGVFKGSAAILGAATGVGKTSMILHAAFNNILGRNFRGKQVKSAIISAEDGPDVIGARVIAEFAGVDSLALRRKDLKPEEIARVKDALKQLEHLPLYMIYSRKLPDILEQIPELAKLGVEIVYMDYIQKIRGVSDDRRAEVGTVFLEIQDACTRHGMAVVFTSQFPRKDPADEPRIWWLKESGDLENEARIIVLCRRDNLGLLHGKLAKSTYGGEGVTFTMRRDKTGQLREIERDIEEDF